MYIPNTCLINSKGTYALVHVWYILIVWFGPKYVTWFAMAIEVKAFFNFFNCCTRWLFMWRIEITHPSVQKLFFCDYICILLLAHMALYHEELVLGMHVTKYANIIAIWFESLCSFLRDQFKELQVALQKITTWTTKLGKGCIEWKIVTYLDTRLLHWKLKTWMKT